MSTYAYYLYQVYHVNTHLQHHVRASSCDSSHQLQERDVRDWRSSSPQLQEMCETGGAAHLSCRRRAETSDIRMPTPHYTLRRKGQATSPRDCDERALSELVLTTRTTSWSVYREWSSSTNTLKTVSRHDKSSQSTCAVMRTAQTLTPSRCQQCSTSSTTPDAWAGPPS